MSEQPKPQPGRNQLASTWPDPPSFWKDFTTENLEAFQKIKTAAEERESEMEEGGLVKRIPNIPEELIHLQPPAEPADGKWRVFGDIYSVRSPFYPFSTTGIHHNLHSNLSSSPAGR